MTAAANDKKSSIVKVYTKLAKRNKGHVSLKDLQANGVTRDMVVHHYGSLSDLDKAARKQHPDDFPTITVESLYSKKALESLRNSVSDTNRFIVTTAVAGAEVDANFLASINTFCSERNAKLLILVAADPASNLPSHSRSWGAVDSILKDETIVMEDTSLNENIFISTIKMSAKQIDPTTGLGRIGQKNGSCIYASPKQRLKAEPVGNHAYPIFMMGTGAITKPEYSSDLYMSQRTAYIAEHDHVMGALIVEIVDDQHFHFRQVQADAKGRFIDLGVQYCPHYTCKAEVEALVMGDFHSGSTDTQAIQASLEQIEVLKPKRVVFHDLFDGISINHHEEGKHLLKAKRAVNGQLFLSAELMKVAADLAMFADKVEEVVVVKSNHDLFLERYLQEARYVEDPYNHRLALELAIQVLDGNDPLAYGVKKYFTGTFSKVRWLKLDEDYRVAGVQLAAHGHIGSNGAKGTIANLEAAYGNCIVGHDHTPGILRGCFRVGTSSRYDLEYKKGPSSWLHTNCILYADGSRQLLNEIGGKWYLP